MFRSFMGQPDSGSASERLNGVPHRFARGLAHLRSIGNRDRDSLCASAIVTGCTGLGTARV
jgi:hypothetical protein